MDAKVFIVIFWGICMEGEKFKAVCSDCGSECEIPFNPTEGRPVKCNDCFRKGRDSRGGGRDRGRGGGRDHGGGNRGFNNNRERRDFDVVCAECGKATTVPFKPTQGKPVLCRDCFKGK